MTKHAYTLPIPTTANVSESKEDYSIPGGAGVGTRVGPLGFSGSGAMVVPMFGAGVPVTSIVTPWKLQ